MNFRKRNFLEENYDDIIACIYSLFIRIYSSIIQNSSAVELNNGSAIFWIVYIVDLPLMVDLFFWSLNF